MFAVKIVFALMEARALITSVINFTEIVSNNAQLTSIDNICYSQHCTKFGNEPSGSIKRVEFLD
jgi:hypothetical protein